MESEHFIIGLALQQQMQETILSGESPVKRIQCTMNHSHIVSHVYGAS